MIKPLKSVIKQVEYCLDQYPGTRDSDTYLWAVLVSTFYPMPERIPATWQEVAEVVAKTPSIGYISKCRRKIIERYDYKKYLPTNEAIANFRGINNAQYKRYAKANPSEITPEPILSNYPSHMTDAEIAELDI